MVMHGFLSNDSILPLPLSLPPQLHETDGIRNRRSNHINPPSVTSSSSTAPTVLDHRKLSSDSTVTQLTLVGDEDVTPPLERKRRKGWQGPPTSPIMEEDEPDMDMDNLLDEIKLNDDFDGKEESKVKEETSEEARTVTVEATVHSQRGTS